MLSRLKKRKDFLTVASSPASRSFYAKHMKIKVLRHERNKAQYPSCSVARFGLTVTRKVGNSVERNRMKRRLRSAVQAAFALCPFNDRSYDIVVMAKRTILEAKFNELTEDVGNAFRKLRSFSASTSLYRKPSRHFYQKSPPVQKDADPIQKDQVHENA